MYKSHCACTGNEQVSVFVKSEICESEKTESFTEESTTSCCSEIEVNGIVEMDESSCCSSVPMATCDSHSMDCECDKPEVTYVKLQNQIVNEEVKFTKTEPIVLSVLYAALSVNFEDFGITSATEDLYIDPPPLISTSQEFLIQIHQLKIPSLA